MSFRDEHDPPARARAAFDPLERYGEIFAALDRDRGWFGDRTPLLLAAAVLATVPGAASDLAAAVRTRDAELARHFGWTSGVDPTLRLVLAATQLRTGEPSDAFIAMIERGRGLMREVGMRRGGVHDVLAVVVLRRITRDVLTVAHIERLRALYEASKRHHWFLTGPEDYVGLAMLTARSGSAESIAEHVEAIFSRLAAAPKIWGGEALQLAAHVLGLVELPASEAADRFLAVAAALRAAGITVRGAQYDEVAVLCLAPRSPEAIATVVSDVRARLLAQHGRALRWLGEAMVMRLATNLSLSGLLQGDQGEVATVLLEAELLLEMQAIAAMRQASGVS